MIRRALPESPRPRLLESIALVFFVGALFALGGCKTIPEGRSSVNEVQVRGAEKVDEEDITDRIATTETTKFLSLFRGILYEYSLFDRFVLQRDLARVEAFYRTKGYYDAHARAGRVHQLDNKHVRVEIVVEEGPPVVVRKVHIDGLEGMPEALVNGANIAAKDALPVDKPFVEEDFTKAEGNVRRTFTDNGYAYAKVTSDAAVDLVTHKVDVVMNVTPGPKSVFGQVYIRGLGEIPDAPIRRTIDITQGKEFSQQALDDAQQALLDLGIFASVELVPELPGAEPKPPNQAPGATDDADGGAPSPPPPPPAAEGPPVIPIRVTVEPSRLRTIKLGFGVEFDSLKTDLHGVIGWESRNFFGGLRVFSVQFRPGVVFYPLRVNNLVPPEKFLPEERLRFELAQPSFIEARLKAFVRPEFNIYPVLINPDPPPDARVIGYGEIRNGIGVERTIWKFFGSLSHNTQIAQPFAYVGTRDPTLGLIVIAYPEIYTTFDFRDDKVHPRKGLFLGNSFQVAGQFEGDANDVKVQPEVRGYVPLARRVVFATRVSLGFLWAQNYGAVVRNGPQGATPTIAGSEERTRDYQLTFFRGFFSGGPNSNRGYPVRGVGPYDVVPFLTPDIEAARINADCGAQCRSPTGGFTLWEASAELRFSVDGPLSVATFCDASDVSPQPNDIRLSHPHLSCGAGGRYDTPAGPIRLDVGYRLPGLQVLGGLTPDEKEPNTFIGGLPIAVHIGIGEAY